MGQISFKELMGNHNIDEIPLSHQLHLEDLLKRINQIRTAWGRPMRVTSGYRSMQDHLRIYSQKGITDRSKIPMQSKHLTGEAVDIADPGLLLTAWLKGDGAPVLEDAGLWCEDGNSNWTHFQSKPPKSGKRWFLP